jgi:hypothetical protein
MEMGVRFYDFIPPECHVWPPCEKRGWSSPTPDCGQRTPVCMGLLLNELHPAPFPRTGFDGHYGDVSIIPVPGIVICSVPGMLTYRRKILAHAHARAAGLSRLLRHMCSFMSSYLFATLSVTLWVRHYHLMTWHEYALSYSALPIV